MRYRTKMVPQSFIEFLREHACFCFSCLLMLFFSWPSFVFSTKAAYYIFLTLSFTVGAGLSR
ncbi:hypothetical protein TRIATDRAFT_251069 [Trichoderma atroviride IMI 206040]|uniref:Uncharacterized protein n=1 Tax=Hypocrea atroviridis (strain ATCC 20476 / IMI 206040) TaxID=452589 RepID=G9P958_HYPAI|nr:uncharacterized protein TRIATDRAFT_251069 [Trichoderma atroviride IMI 206040]EHK41876.1 hypothetical protein TRIATDRAFT_251069 [Trichoderma atroviride IMI 206040]